MSEDENKSECQCGKAHEGELTDQETEEVAGGVINTTPPPTNHPGVDQGHGARDVGNRELGDRGRDGIIITLPPPGGH